MTWTLAFLVAGASVSLVLAFIILLREEPSIAQRSFAVGMALLGLDFFLSSAVAYVLSPERMVHLQSVRLVLLTLLPGTWLIFTLSYAQAEPGQQLTRWRIAIWAFYVLPLATGLIFRNSLCLPALNVSGAEHWTFPLQRPGVLLLTILLLGTALVLMNLERLLRTSTGVMRWRLKYLVLGLGIIFAVRLYTLSQQLLYNSLTTANAILNALAVLLGAVLIAVSLTRGRFHGSDLYLSPTILYRSVTVMLVGIYLFVVGLLAKLATYADGEIWVPITTFLFLLALATLAILLFSDRLRHKIRLQLNRHFRRPQRDYRSIWADFSHRTGSQVNIDEFCRAVVDMISDTFEVLSASLWLIDSARDRLIFGASTSIPEADAQRLASEVRGLSLLAENLRHQTPVINLSEATGDWAESLRRCNPVSFRGKGGHLHGLPLLAGGQVLGILALGDRVSGVPLNLEEHDLLETIGEQIGASLLNFNLSQQLLESKELEAFQTMSTFFVHDLKNTSASLSLMLKNLPRHFDNPEFRKDALHSIDQSVQRINQLVHRLTMIREKLQLERKAIDINELIENVLKSLPPTDGQSITCKLQKTPAVLLDPDQIRNVLVNLILNARDAIGDNGSIDISTEHSRLWCTLTVSDDGCGMTRDFIERSLFRPFQSTKKTGLGIGLFQTKTIIEAHHGKIEVESEEGRGCTIRVFLPMNGERMP